MGIYENIKEACKVNKISVNKLEQELGFARSSVSKFNSNTPSIEKVSLIAKRLNVSVDYLLSGGHSMESKATLTEKDERDIAKKLDRIMSDIDNNNDAPLYYNGEEIDEMSKTLLKAAIESAMRQMKIINKEKYNPNKNKK